MYISSIYKTFTVYINNYSLEYIETSQYDVHKKSTFENEQFRYVIGIFMDVPLSIDAV